jgi:hypothetical protein
VSGLALAPFVRKAKASGETNVSVRCWPSGIHVSTPALMTVLLDGTMRSPMESSPTLPLFDSETLPLGAPINFALKLDRVVERASELAASEESAKICKEALINALLTDEDKLVDLTDSAREQAALEQVGTGSSTDNSRTVAAALVRLLPERNAQWLHEMPWRIVVSKAIDRELSGTVLKELPNNRKYQTHEQFEQIARHVREVESDLQKALAELSSLERLDSFRKQFFKALNRPGAAAVIQPFLPPSASTAINYFCELVKVYIDGRAAVEVVELSRSAQDNGEILVQAILATPTTYARRIVNEVISKLLRFVAEDIKSNPVVLATNLTIKTFDKKYPLHLVEVPIDVSFLVENTGKGHAHDVSLTVVGNTGIHVLDPYPDLGRLPPGTRQLVVVRMCTDHPGAR